MARRDYLRNKNKLAFHSEHWYMPVKGGLSAALKKTLRTLFVMLTLIDVAVRFPKSSLSSQCSLIFCSSVGRNDKLSAAV